MFERFVNVVSPGAYVVSDGRGDIGASSKEGLFYRDTRHLSGFVLRVNGEAPVALDARARGSEAEFVLAVGAGSIRVVRWRTLGGGMAEEILLKNYAREAVEARVELGCAADFRDVFDVRGYHRAQERGELAEEAGDGCLRFAYRRGGFWRGTVVRVSSEGEEVLVEPGLAYLDLRLGPGESRLVRASVLLEESGEEIRWRRPALLYAEAPEVETPWEVLRKSWERSVEDLKSLSFDAGDGMVVPAAGAPWYMALFGRDALISAYQIMILDSEPAKNVLRVLAKYQAAERDDFRDAEPGKILHELRFGELTFFGEVPHSPYYGTVDATPLFLILLHEVWRWTADEGFVRGLEGAARRAISWLLEHADTNGDGYVDYETRSERGLENHSWKDSADSMLFRNGTRAEGPIASCEVQGYAYDALLRTAELAEVVWGDAELARRLRGEAGELKERFDQDFWIEEGGYYALALDGAGRRVDSLTSNIGHLLWSGIVPAEKARAVVDHLLGGRLFGGFGVRTMAEGDVGYDAEGYHTGTVWPHDNSLVAYGLYRCGFREEANYLTATLLDAAPHFHYRLPEVFAGYSREQASSPIPYPTSCSPQAWAAGSVPLLLRAMLGLEPDPHKRRLLFDPALPEDVSAVGLLDLTVFGRRYDLRA